MDSLLGLARGVEAHPDPEGSGRPEGRGCPGCPFSSCPLARRERNQRTTLANFLKSHHHPLLWGGLRVEVSWGAEERGKGGWCSAEPDFT